VFLGWQIFDANDTKLAIHGCTEGEPRNGTASSCPKLYDGQKEPSSALFTRYAPPATAGLASYAWVARTGGRGRVTLDLGVGPTNSTRVLSRIVVYMASRMRDRLANQSLSATVDAFLSTTAIAEGSLANHRYLLIFCRTALAHWCLQTYPSIDLGFRIITSAPLLVRPFYGVLPAAAVVFDDTQVVTLGTVSNCSWSAHFLCDTPPPTTKLTPASSFVSLSCVPCPSHSTISNLPRTSAKVNYRERVSCLFHYPSQPLSIWNSTACAIRPIYPQEVCACLPRAYC
jgi:hypothetical protein